MALCFPSLSLLAVMTAAALPPALRRTFAAAMVFASTLHVAAHPSTRPHSLLAQTPPASAVVAATEPTVPLTLELRLPGSNAPAAGLVRITRVAPQQTVDLPAHLRRPMGWASFAGRATVNVPIGELRIEACHGLETEIATTTLVTARDRPPPPVTLALTRFYSPRERRLVGANTHLHLQLHSPRGMAGAWLRTRAEAEEYLNATARSDALDLVYVSHLIRSGESQNYVSNMFTRDDLLRWSDVQARFANGEEHRHEGGRSSRRGGPDELRYGHVLFLDLPRLVEPASYGAIFTAANPASDAIPMRRAIQDARAQHATIVWCHGKQGTEDVPDWLDGLIHAQNIFDGGSEGSFETVFYTYLNAGLRVPFSTGTDWGSYDFSRVYVPLAGEADSRAFRAALAAGRSFITNGTFLEFSADGHVVGDALDMPTPKTVRLRGRGLGRDDFTRLEVVFNGAVVAQVAARRVAGHYEADLDTSLELREPGWLALRIPTTMPYNDRTAYTGPGTNLFGKALFAHTSPVYATLAGRSVCQPAAVQQLIAETELAIRTIEAKGAFASTAERDALLALYHAAIAQLRAKLPR